MLVLCQYFSSNRERISVTTSYHLTSCVWSIFSTKRDNTSDNILSSSRGCVSSIFSTKRDNISEDILPSSGGRVASWQAFGGFFFFLGGSSSCLLLGENKLTPSVQHPWKLKVYWLHRHTNQLVNKRLPATPFKIYQHSLLVYTMNCYTCLPLTIFHAFPTKSTQPYSVKLINIIKK